MCRCQWDGCRDRQASPHALPPPGAPPLCWVTATAALAVASADLYPGPDWVLLSESQESWTAPHVLVTATYIFFAYRPAPLFHRTSFTDTGPKIKSLRISEGSTRALNQMWGTPFENGTLWDCTVARL